MASRPLPLAGLLVADFSRVLAGPYASMALADLGARVIKVERTGAGDDTRAWSPPPSERGSTYFDSVNRNKESLELDLGSPEDRAVALELARRADVLIENFKPGTMAKYGLGYERLRELNPRLVYASISGFGSGAGASLPGYDFLVQAVGGLMSISGSAHGEPTKVGVALVDVLTGKDVQVGVLAALVERGVTGTGASFEVNLLSSLQSALVNQVQSYLGAGVVPGRMGNAHPSIVPYQLFDCRDGSLAIACGNDTQFAALCRVLGADRLASDERYRTNPARVRHRDDLVLELESLLSTETPARWAERMTAAGVPAGAVASIDESIAFAESLELDPTIALSTADGRDGGRQVRAPQRWLPARTPRTNAPPTLGQHNDTVRSWLAEPYSRPSATKATGTDAETQEDDLR
ncbi:CaiB/BaiF CoA-transferase family protein [Herbiconiux sp. L3-i23]|uniref:CaiB/BaiF CoA transferase family protein n=1 Tax=Herbiconiux sp. L3-i23 TaxID=2905871 RepID=UPI0020662B79|nr:CoA transferase [Herbiconiux sp. L3-i23]BDI23484.1 CoA transferase [Herbiconiux sp. L3-i23]